MRRRRTWAWAGAVVLSALLVTTLWLRLGDRDPDQGTDPAVEHPGSSRSIPPAPVEPRVRTHAAWSEHELLVWSGAMPGAVEGDDPAGEIAFEVLDDGAAYEPATGTWRTLPTAPIPGRVGAAAVWAGDRLVVWGGFSDPDRARDDGAMYLPDSDTWVTLPPAPVTGRGDATAVWTGREVLIVGGAERPGRYGRVSGLQRDGAAYDPVADRWRVLPSIPDGIWPLRNRGVSPIRERFAGTWTGDALFMWGRDVAHYRPETDTWERTSAPPADIRIGGAVTAVRIGSLVAVLGLAARDDPDSFGITHESASGDFGAVPALPSGSMHTQRTFVALDEHVVVLTSDPAAAAIWNPGAGTWRSIPPALARGTEAAAVWTGTELLVWGGSDAAGPRADGLAWRP